VSRQHPLWQLILMRWRVFSREPASVFWAYGFPLVLALVLGMAFRNKKPEPVWAAVQAGPAAEQTAAALESHGVHAFVADDRAAFEALRVGRVSLVVIPGATRVYKFDETRPESRLARALVDDALQRADGRVDPTQVENALVTEPGARYIDFLIPGLVGLGLMSAGLWGVGFVLVDMRTRRLIKRMAATPMRKSHFLLSFSIVRALFLLVELPVLLGFGWWVFGVPVRGSIVLLVALATLGSVSFAGMGLLVASRTDNNQTAQGLINLVSMPMMLGSGVFFPASRFPHGIQPVLEALPLTALIDAFRAVMIDGAGLMQVMKPTAIFLAWGVLSFVAALRLFKWR
jgi:ABC-type multidrug transport system permease subunit